MAQFLRSWWMVAEASRNLGGRKVEAAGRLQGSSRKGGATWGLRLPIIYNSPPNKHGNNMI